MTVVVVVVALLLIIVAVVVLKVYQHVWLFTPLSILN